ncbi:MAG: transposase [Nitrospirales bacterium]|nr:transposase [Nitrospirales bacterium]
MSFPPCENDSPYSPFLSHYQKNRSIIDPRRAKAVIQTKNKTDKLDARNLAELAQVGWYTAVHRKTPAARLQRTHLQTRKGLVETAKAQAARIRGLLRALSSEWFENFQVIDQQKCGRWVVC